MAKKIKESKAEIMRKQLTVLIDEFDLYDYEFADMMGINRSVLSTTLNGRCIPTMKQVYRIIEVLPTLNLNWLITGEGKQWLGIKPKIIKSASGGVPRVAHK